MCVEVPFRLLPPYSHPSYRICSYIRWARSSSRRRTSRASTPSSALPRGRIPREVPALERRQRAARPSAPPTVEPLPSAVGESRRHDHHTRTAWERCMRWCMCPRRPPGPASGSASRHSYFTLLLRAGPPVHVECRIDGTQLDALKRLSPVAVSFFSYIVPSKMLITPLALPSASPPAPLRACASVLAPLVRAHRACK